MEVTSSPPTMDSSKVPFPQGQVQKKRKFGHEKVVVTVKVEGSSSSTTTNQKNEGPPSDPWSWRKYGQKPIKGSPYPRGYYRCSTSKGCSAKKQVERCRTDPSLLIITYTSNHSHADPVDLLENASNQFMETSCSTSTPSPKQLAEEPETTEKEKEERNDNNEDEHSRYCLQSSPLYISKKDIETTYDPHSPPPQQIFLVNENSKKPCPSYDPHSLTTLSADLQNSEENNDFYDELEELPTSSFFSSFMRRNFFEERILVNPS